ncbi:hypothetical protein [Myxococcus stipitatus]|uniref:hypothetical protein n=1 Tax=Myxococcus stipitatus TaxID=83455 RepID=UPI003CC8A8EA
MERREPCASTRMHWQPRRSSKHETNDTVFHLARIRTPSSSGGCLLPEAQAPDHPPDVVLLEQVPRIGRLAKVMETRREIAARLERFLRAYQDRLVVPDTKVAAFVVETIVESLTHRRSSRRRTSSTPRRWTRSPRVWCLAICSARAPGPVRVIEDWWTDGAPHTSEARQAHASMWALHTWGPLLERCCSSPWKASATASPRRTCGNCIAPRD